MRKTVALRHIAHSLLGCDLTYHKLGYVLCNPGVLYGYISLYVRRQLGLVSRPMCVHVAVKYKHLPFISAAPCRMGLFATCPLSNNVLRTS